MPNGTIYFTKQRGRGTDFYGYRVESMPGLIIDSGSDMSPNNLLRVARRYTGYRPMFNGIPRGLQTDLKQQLRR